ncbi:hypothetical protein B0H16DRAFT_1250899, partial [Mycena metata]
MLASNGCEPTITHFLRLHRAKSPSTIPSRIILDFDWAEINSCVAVYHLFLLLCWWHVLHAWQQHLRITEHPELWELLKKWIRIADANEFTSAWVKIQSMAPRGFKDYLIRFWMPERVLRMWSAVYRLPRSIFEACDTNMLIEAWHHVLKWKFLHGKRNRRVDHLLKTLLEDVLPYYALKQRRQEFGFEGPDIEAKKRMDVIERSKIYVKTDIIQVSEEQFIVPSKNNPSKFYEVDLEAYTCTCDDYPLICFCKHLCAVQTLFDEPGAYADESSRPPLQVPGLSSLQTDPPQVQQHSEPSQKAAKKIVTALAEKLEILAARLRHPRRQNNFPDLLPLEQALDDVLAATDRSSVLPTSQRLPPNQSTAWSKTKNDMMPAIKTKRQKAGDPAYGGGASSGGKAPKSDRI